VCKNGQSDKEILYFLCGTAGKTTLSIQKKINGDDEHGWTSENTVFNFERKHTL
jgi:phosphoenolpyruvate carboxykinase (ATP)